MDETEGDQARKTGIAKRLEGEINVTTGNSYTIYTAVEGLLQAAQMMEIDVAKSQAVVLQLYTWERERLLTLAKGVGGAAVTVLAALIADATQGSVDSPSVWVVYLAGALVALLLVWGAFILSGLRRLAEQYSLALLVVS
ncbi:MAG: hypothetical protein ABI776_03455 [Nocardioidaceae bacterium]